MIKKIIFWFYVAVGPLFVIFFTFGESLWPLRIPYDYIYTIVVGSLAIIISTILMTNKNLNLAKRKYVYFFTPIIVYFVLVPFVYYFIDGRLDKLRLLFLLFMISLFITAASHIDVLIYKHWINPIIKPTTPDIINQSKWGFKHLSGMILKIVTLSTMMIFLPVLWFALIISFNSEFRIDFKAYLYEQTPSTENLTDLAIDLLNYRGYEERIKYLPIIMEDEAVLQKLYESRDNTDRAEIYSLMGDTNLSFIGYQDEAKALVMTQYINAFLMLGRNQEYLELMTTRTEQFGRGDFYYMFEGNVIMYNREYKPVLSDMLNLLEQVYDTVDVNDKELLFQRMYNIRIRQTIYYLFEDVENDAALEVQFNQLLEELKAYKESQIEK